MVIKGTVASKKRKRTLNRCLFPIGKAKYSLRIAANGKGSVSIQSSKVNLTATPSGSNSFVSSLYFFEMELV